MTYTLPDGKTAEVVMVADDAARGDGYIFVDGEAIVHSSYDDVNGVNSWTSSAPGAATLTNAALEGLAGEAGNELLDAFVGESQAFKCSGWGKKVLRAGKYIWGGVVAAGMVTCCLETAWIGCPICAGAMGAAGLAGADALDDYCE